jgi:predicted dehydrogenase
MPAVRVLACNLQGRCGMSASDEPSWSRRQLLRGTGAALLGGALAETLGACAHASGGPSTEVGPNASTGRAAKSPVPGAIPMEKRVGFALVGLGKLSLGELLPAFALCKLARPAALVSGNRAKAEKVAKQYGIDAAHIYDYATFDRLRDDAAVQAVYVVLPNGMHAEYSIRAAQAGKHVLCEKPMAKSVAECQQMIDASQKAQKQLMIAYRMQYEPFNREAIRMARSGELGKLKNFLTSNGQLQKDPSEWRLKRALAGGGPLPDLGIYCLNAARYLSGEEPIEVSALQHSSPNDPRFREVEEQIDFTLRFPSGLLASCATSYSVHGSKGYRLLGDKAWVELDPAYPYRGQRMRISRGDSGDEQLIEPKLEAQNQFALELDHMAQCVLEGRRPHTPGEEGMQDMRLIAAIYAAADSGRSVTLPALERPDAFRGPLPAGVTLG